MLLFDIKNECDNVRNKNRNLTQKLSKRLNTLIIPIIGFIFIFGSLNLNAVHYPSGLVINQSNAVAFEISLSNSVNSFGGDLVITQSVNLNLTNPEMQFGNNVRLIIDPNSQLHIYGTNTLLTHYVFTDKWSGVEVRGLFGSSSSSGVFEMRGGTIKNALVGVANYNKIHNLNLANSSGGNIVIGSYNGQPSTFLNCYQGVVIANYNFNHNHRFLDIDFIWNSNSPYTEQQTFKPMFHVNGNANVGMNNCRFTNTNTDIFYLQPHTDRCAIYVENGGSIRYDVSGNNGVSSVDGFVYGTVVESQLPSSIKNIDFTSYRGIWLYNNFNSDIRYNNFDHINLSYLPFIMIGSSSTAADNQFGIYSEKSSGYTIAYNNIYFPDNEEKESGILINKSEGNPNIVEHNTIDGCAGTGIVSYFSNRNTSGSVGLKIECNQLDNNFGDIEVTSGTPGPDQGIAGTQGIAPFVGLGTSAGNSFSSAGGNFSDNLPNNGFHLYNETGAVGSVDYYYNNLDGLLEADGDVNIFNFHNGSSVQENPGCAFQLANSSGDYLDEANNHKELRDNANLQLTAILDGGD